MSWTPSSKGTALVVLLALAVTAVGAAGAISVSEESAPSEAEAGSIVEAEVLIEDPFVNMSDQWTLVGQTELEDPTWTVTIIQQGEEVNSTEYEGSQSFRQALNASNGGDTVRVKLTGEVPGFDAVGGPSYDPQQQFSLYDLNAIEGAAQSDLDGGASQIPVFTTQSQDAREAIESAEQTLNETNAGQGAQDRLDQAISAYNSGNFDNAISIAEDAESMAEESEESEQTQQTLIYGGVAVVVLVLVGGGIYYWRSQQDDYEKLR